jgi:hypothetical protein
VDEGGVVLQRLHQVRGERVLEDGGHRAVRVDVARENRAAFSKNSLLALSIAVLFLLTSIETYKALIDSSTLGTKNFILRFSTS